MSVANYENYKLLVAQPTEDLGFTSNSFGIVPGKIYSNWRTLPVQGAVPSTPAVPTRATVGCFGQANATSGTRRIVAVNWAASNFGARIICDRLSHQGGLSGIVTGAQTTNLPTAALTRYTSGDGVMLGVEIYTTVGTSSVALTASYTNQAGTSGHVTPVTAFGATGNREAQRMLILPLQAGDSGVRSVQSITLATSTGTAGAFGVTLFKPLVHVPITSGGSRLNPLFGLVHQTPPIVDDACLFQLLSSSASTSGITQVVFGFGDA